MDRRTGIALVLVAAILCAGCAGIGGYQPGDVISFDDKPQNVAYVILDERGDQYLKASIHTDNLGRWRLVDVSTKKWEDKDKVHRFYSHWIEHVEVDDLWAI